MDVLLSVSREPGFYPLCSHFRCCCGYFFFFFPQDQGQRKNGNKSITFAVKKEGRESKGFKIGHRCENMNILAKKAKQKGTLPETAPRPV